MYPHRIRLHGPWDFEPLSQTVVRRDGRVEQRPGPVPAAGRLKIPTVWIGTPLQGFRGRVRWRRKFHAPRTLEPHERLGVAFDGVDYFAEIHLNGSPLGRHEGYFEPFAVQLESTVREHNELVVEVDCPAELDPANPRLIRSGLESRVPEFVAGLWRDVALEIRSFAHFADVTVRTSLDGTTGNISVTGIVHRTMNEPVELELSVNGVAVDQEKLLASLHASPFMLDARLNDVESWWPSGLGRPVLYAIRLEMHGAARTLDCVERHVGFRNISYDSGVSQATINGRTVPTTLVECDSRSDPLFTDHKSFAGILSDVNEFGTLPIFRVPGRVTAPAFYDWADAHGCLLLQDLPWHAGSRADLEHDPEFPEIEREIVRQSKAMKCLLGHHPSIAGGISLEPIGT